MSTELSTKSSVTDIGSFKELMDRADFLAKSSLIPSALRQKPADVAVILQMGLELGIPPMQAINGIDVIQGKPCVSPQLGLALIHAKVASAKIEFRDLSEDRAVVFMARDRARPEEGYTATWDMEKARKMSLDSKDNYQKQPGNMLKWRAVGEAARAVFPDVLKGFYLSVEMMDMPPEDPNGTKIKDINAKIGLGENQELPKEPTPVVAELVSAADFEITFGQRYKGKKLSDLSAGEITAFISSVENAMAKINRPLEPEHVEFKVKALQYLEELKAKDSAS